MPGDRDPTRKRPAGGAGRPHQDIRPPRPRVTGERSDVGPTFSRMRRSDAITVARIVSARTPCDCDVEIRYRHVSGVPVCTLVHDAWCAIWADAR